MCKISVFTPVYNRADLISNVYSSLLKQNVDKELFEWLVVDDGSTDNLKEVIDDYISENKININYYYKENGGVHTAWNFGVKQAKGEYFFRCDSDDELFSDTLKKLISYLDKYAEHLSSDCVGIVGLCERKEGKHSSIIGGKFPSDFFLSTGLEMNFRHHLHGERAGCMKTDILKKYPLDEPGDVNFVFESTMWYRIDRDYKTICVNDSFKYYTENGSDSISVGIQRDLNAKYCTSQFYCYAFYINQIFDYMLLDKSFLIRIIINITRRGMEAGRNITEIYNSIHDVRKRFLVILASPIGIVLSIMDKIKYK